MKIKIERNKINKKIVNVSKAVAQVSHLPSLLGILITVNESSIELLASDGNLSIKEVIKISKGIEILEQGSVLVPGKLFRDVISKQEKDILINTNNNTLFIESAGSKTEIQLFDKEDYPKISFEGFGKDLILDSDLLRKLLKDVGYAAAYEDRRIILNGINLKASNKMITASATNSFRLAQEKIKIDSSVEFNFTILTKKLKDFIPTDFKGDMTINVDDSKIITRVDGTTVSSRLIDGVYPPIEKLFVNNYETEIRIDKKELEKTIELLTTVISSIDKKELEKTIELITVVSSESNKVIKLILRESSLNLEGRKTEKGYSNSKIKNFKHTGTDIEIAFDANFLKDAISNLNGEVIMKFNGSFKPFSIESDSKKELKQIILPHRTL